ncbi:AAA family ATPase [Nonomuraea sp. K274]|uniref:AAA family ATPase n=1 Tax=Nonomuraea cypriaca TaxID=1187855 RepID=A0A931EY24_9ACTN|nr:AAA family ATPase [Nonomuraea cypriaca]MBF8186037.1 AAA family ATPase [Nonomuraea cypriaca]
MLVVLVNGLPGAGKTTVARGLGRALGLPVFSKDDLKETLADMLERPGGVGEREWSRRLGAAPLGLGPVFSVDTSISVDISGLAELCEAPQ